jgi:hypothetical protein
MTRGHEVRRQRLAHADGLASLPREYKRDRHALKPSAVRNP